MDGRWLSVVRAQCSGLHGMMVLEEQRSCSPLTCVLAYGQTRPPTKNAHLHLSAFSDPIIQIWTCFSSSLILSSGSHLLHMQGPKASILAYREGVYTKTIQARETKYIKNKHCYSACARYRVIKVCCPVKGLAVRGRVVVSMDKRSAGLHHELLQPTKARMERQYVCRSSSFANRLASSIA